MELLKLFWAFFVSNILGYGGGPSSIPLIQKEVVDHFHWLSNSEFGDALALGNALPGPIATKMAGFVGYRVFGIAGATIAVVATVLPSAIAMVLLHKFVFSLKDSPVVKSMTRSVQPIIAVLLGILTYQFTANAWQHIGFIQTVLLLAASYFALEVKKIHPAFVVAASLLYGAVFLS
jgi:chromate transporter